MAVSCSVQKTWGQWWTLLVPNLKWVSKHFTGVQSVVFQVRLRFGSSLQRGLMPWRFTNAQKSLVCPFQHYRTDKCLRLKYEICFSSKSDSTVGSLLNNCSSVFDWQTARPSGLEFTAELCWERVVWRLKWFSLEILLLCFTIEFYCHSRLAVMKLWLSPWGVCRWEETIERMFGANSWRQFLRHLHLSK